MRNSNNNNINVDSLNQGTFYTILCCLTEVDKYSNVCFFVIAGEKGDKSIFKFELTSDSLLQITVVEIFCGNLGTLSTISKNNSVLLSLCLRNFLKSLQIGVESFTETRIAFPLPSHVSPFKLSSRYSYFYCQ